MNDYFTILIRSESLTSRWRGIGVIKCGLFRIMTLTIQVLPINATVRALFMNVEPNAAPHATKRSRSLVSLSIRIR